MTPRRRALRVTVAVERSGASLVVSDVALAECAGVLAACLDAMRATVATYPELRTIVECVPGGAPIAYEDDSDLIYRRRAIGFTVR